jgi:hypothetical protein
VTVIETKMRQPPPFCPSGVEDHCSEPRNRALSFDSTYGRPRLCSDRTGGLALIWLLLVTTGCTHLVWYGRSDDRRHIVSVIEQPGGQHVRLDMIDGPTVLGIGVDALVLTDTGHLAYPAQFANGWAVIHDGKQGRTFDAIGELQLTNDYLAYTAEKSGKWHVVHDGTVSEAFDAVLPGSLTLGPNGRFAFAAQQGPSVFAFIDGKRSAPMDAVGQLRFSSDGTRSGFVGRKQGSSSVVIDGVERGPFESVTELQLGPPELFIARTPGALRVFTGEQPGASFERIAGLISGPAYAGRRGKQEWIIDGPRQLGPFSSIKSQLLRDSAGRLVFVAQRDDAWLVSIDGTESGPWADVEAPAIGGAHVGFIAERDGRHVLMLDGKEHSTWEWAASLVLGPDGTRVAHLARRGGKTFVVVDGVEHQYDVVVAGTLAFSKDGRRFGCVTGDAKTRRLFITRDDGKRTQVDMEEVVAALSRGNQDALLTSPDVTLLRRWVAAELEH